MKKMRENDGKRMNLEVERISKEEVRKNMKRARNGKAVGPDDIPVEVWECLGESALEFLTKGAMLHTYENLFLGTLPKRLILWYIVDAYNGEYSKHRFTSTDVRFWPNRSSQTSRPAATFEATSTCFPPPVNKHRTKGTSCRAMNLAKAIPSSASI